MLTYLLKLFTFLRKGLFIIIIQKQLCVNNLRDIYFQYLSRKGKNLKSLLAS